MKRRRHRKPLASRVRKIGEAMRRDPRALPILALAMLEAQCAPDEWIEVMIPLDGGALHETVNARPGILKGLLVLPSTQDGALPVPTAFCVGEEWRPINRFADGPSIWIGAGVRVAMRVDNPDPDGLGAIRLKGHAS